jgi:DNA polymerase-3 subunit gamma/tau
LDQVIAFTSRKILEKDIVSILGIAGVDRFGRLMSAIIDRDPTAALTVVQELFREGYDPEQFILDLIQYVRDLIVAAAVPKSARVEGIIDAPASELEEMERLSSRSSPHELQNFFSILLRSEGEIKRSANPWIVLEMTILKMAYAPELVDLSEIIRRLDSGAASPRRTAPERKTQSRVRTPPGKSSTKTVSPAKNEVADEIPSNRFTITKVMPIPSGTPDEVWANLKELLKKQNDEILFQVMEHGTLLAFGPTEVEIGFNKEFYKEAFEKRLEKNPLSKQTIEDFFGGARIKILILAQPTSLDTSNPYATQSNGESDFNRALKNEAMENPVTRAALLEFEGSFVEDIKILTTTKT